MFVLAACDAGWVKFNGACYKFESDAKQYFGGAVTACNEMDAHLLHIESEAENDFILSHLQENFARVRKWRAGARKDGARFVWVDGRRKKLVKVSGSR